MKYEKALCPIAQTLSTCSDKRQILTLGPQLLAIRTMSSRHVGGLQMKKGLAGCDTER